MVLIHRQNDGYIICANSLFTLLSSIIVFSKSRKEGGLVVKR